MPLLTRDNIHPGRLEDVLKTNTLHDDVGDCLRYGYKSMQDPNARAMAFRRFDEQEKDRFRRIRRRR